jgi:hypothetical protein
LQLKHCFYFLCQSWSSLFLIFFCYFTNLNLFSQSHPLIKYKIYFVF